MKNVRMQCCQMVHQKGSGKRMLFRQGRAGMFCFGITEEGEHGAEGSDVAPPPARLHVLAGVDQSRHASVVGSEQGRALAGSGRHGDLRIVPTL